MVAAAAATTLQAQNAQVSGQIVNASHAAISGAKVILARGETGDQRENTSGSEGYYPFPLLIPGHYDLRVEKSGFQSQAHSGIVVLTGSISTVDVALKVGTDTQTVSVDASVPLLQTETSAVALVVENESITNMPLIDRRASQLQRLSGFAVQTNSGQNAAFSVAGSRSNNADYTSCGS